FFCLLYRVKGGATSVHGTIKSSAPKMPVQNPRLDFGTLTGNACRNLRMCHVERRDGHSFASPPARHAQKNRLKIRGGIQLAARQMASSSRLTACAGDNAYSGATIA